MGRRVNHHTQPRLYLEARARKACDRMGVGRSTPEWTLADVTAVRALPEQRHGGNVLPVYETLTREIARRDGLL